MTTTPHVPSPRCGYTIVDSDGQEQPCDRPATGWRWYQDVEHEDTLDVACSFHENEGGRRMAEAERLSAELADARVRAIAAIRAVPRRMGTPEWSTGQSVAQAVGFDVGLAVAIDAVDAALSAASPTCVDSGERIDRDACEPDVIRFAHGDEPTADYEPAASDEPARCPHGHTEAHDLRPDPWTRGVCLGPAASGTP